MVDYKFNSLEDYLISKPLTIDVELDDGWGALYPLKGREINATILYCDISYFSKRTLDLSSTEILMFVNNFFSWITAEALRETRGIVDKYIGDEVMIVFSKEFGSEDPFLDAIQAARWMCEHDPLNFCPHIGIASGLVTVGYTGTPLKYSCSVFGVPVTYANRCTSVKPSEEAGFVGSSIVFPASEWTKRNFEDVFPPNTYKYSDGEIQEMPQSWELLNSRNVEMKNIGYLEIREVVNRLLNRPMTSIEEICRETIEKLKHHGFYRPNT